MFNGEQGSLHPIPQPQAIKNVGNVVLYRPFADKKLSCNFAIGRPVSNQVQHFQFALCQIDIRWLGCFWLVSNF